MSYLNLKKILLSLFVIFSLTLFILFKQANKTSFHFDESGWISSAYYYTNLLLKLDFDQEKWRGRNCGPWGSINMNLPKFLLGVHLKIYSYFLNNKNEFFGIYNINQNYLWNQAQKKIPPKNILIAGRLNSILFASLSCILIFLIGIISSKNYLIGFLYTAIIILNPLFLETTTRAMCDAHYIFFLLLPCLYGFLIIYKKTLKNIHAVIFGVLIGLVTSIKISGIVIVTLFFTCLLIYRFFLYKENLKLYIKSIFICLGIGFITIYILNPFFLPKFEKTKKDSDKNLEFLREKQKIDMIEKTPALKKFFITHEMAYPFEKPAPYTNLLELPYLFKRWDNLISIKKIVNNSIKNNKSDYFNRLIEINYYIFLKYVSLIGEFLLFLIGLFFSIKEIKEHKNSLIIVPIIYFSIIYLITLIFLPIFFERYFLPVIIASRFFTAFGFYKSIKLLLPSIKY